MNEDAVAPVIAVMLILAIGVTFFSVYTTTYLPALKERAEVVHLSEVEKGILKFSSDIENAVCMKNEGILSEQIVLGGGDILLNPQKSSGTVRIRRDQNPCLVIRNGSGDEYHLHLVNYSYTPTGNFWTDQGYTWQYGYVNVIKGTRSTPLQDYVDASGMVKTFGKSLVSIDSSDRHDVVFTTVNFSKSDRDYSSGNGVAKLILNATRPVPIHFSLVSEFTVSVNSASQVNATLYDDIYQALNESPWYEVTLNPPEHLFVRVLDPPCNITINEFHIELETR